MPLCYPNITTIDDAMRSGAGARVGWMFSELPTDASRIAWLSVCFPSMSLLTVELVLQRLRQGWNEGQKWQKQLEDRFGPFHKRGSNRSR